MTQIKHLRIGLTGGIASGKSTVGRLMQDLGCFVTDADRLVAELYQPGEQGAIAIASEFGGDYLDQKGAVDKERLASLVFADADARSRLEQLIHPLVTLRFAQQSLRADGIVVFEATLLVEGGGYRNFDRLVTVEAKPVLRLQRAIERGLSKAEARARMKAQATEEQRVEVADFVIRNEGSLDDLRQETEHIVESLLAELEARAGA